LLRINGVDDSDIKWLYPSIEDYAKQTSELRWKATQDNFQDLVRYTTDDIF